MYLQSTQFLSEMRCIYSRLSLGDRWHCSRLCQPPSLDHRGVLCVLDWYLARINTSSVSFFGLLQNLRNTRVTIAERTEPGRHPTRIRLRDIIAFSF